MALAAMTDAALPAAPVDRIRWVVQFLAELDGAQPEWLLGVFQTYLGASNDLTLDRAFEVDDDWRRRALEDERLKLEAKRRQLLIDAARQHFAGLAPSKQATKLALAISRYEASSWSRDRRVGVVSEPGKLKWHCYQILASGQPHSERTIRRILCESVV